MKLAKKVPASALKCEIGEFRIGDNGDDAKTAPIHLLALGGQVIDHWFFGPIIHDLEGMEHKQRIPIDYCHNSSEVIGYINKFSTDGQLGLDGALVPFKDDRATEVIHKMKAGVPYQASIDYTPTKPDEVQMEEFGANETVLVNGQEFSGPLAVVRKWKLGGVAVCPYGADSDTSAYLQAKGESEKEIVVMNKEEEKKDSVEAEKLEANSVEESVEKGVEALTKEDAVSVEPVEEKQEKEDTEPCADCALTRDDYLSMVQKFGKEKAAEYFEQGIEMDEAHELFVKSIVEENKALKEQLSVKRAKFDALEDGADVEQFSVNKKAIEKYAKSHGKSFDEVKNLFIKK